MNGQVIILKITSQTRQNIPPNFEDLMERKVVSSFLEKRKKLNISLNNVQLKKMFKRGWKTHYSRGAYAEEHGSDEFWIKADVLVDYNPFTANPVLQCVYNGYHSRDEQEQVSDN